jgi:hypothetical protein
MRVPKLRKNIYLSLQSWRLLRALKEALRTPENPEITEREVVERALSLLAKENNLWRFMEPCKHIKNVLKNRVFCSIRAEWVPINRCIKCIDYNKPTTSIRRD